MAASQAAPQPSDAALPRDDVAPSPKEPEAATDTSFDSGADESNLGPQLDLHGFADAMFTFWPKSSIWSRFYREHSSFGVGNVNLYLDGTLSPQWSSLIEVRFMYLPRGSEDFAGSDDSQVALTNTTVFDYNEFNRSIEWGSIRLERVVLEWHPREQLALRFGQFITPMGIWNEDHGSPTIIGADRPVVVGQELFPEVQTGLHAFGQVFVQRVALGYDLTLSNGRGSFAEFVDLDANKAVGGRLRMEVPVAGQLEVAIGAYRGRFTAQSGRGIVLTPVGDRFDVELLNVPSRRFEELSYGAELRWLSGGFVLQAEYQVNEAVYDDDYRESSGGFEAPGALAADYRRLGGYALIGYRTPWLGIMPYTLVHHLNFGESDVLPATLGATLGLNVRPTPPVVFKVEYSAAMFEDPGSIGVGNDEVKYFKSQVAWAF